jgi:hypothetical protein
MRIRIETIRTRNRPDLAKQVKAAIDAAIDAEVEDLRKDFGKATRTWSKQPTWSVKKTRDGAKFTTRQKVFRFVDYGTTAHIIVPKRATFLSFRVGGRPKTKPGQLKAGAGRPGKTQVYARLVRHPGTKARNFSKLVAERSKKRFPKRFADILRRKLA